MTRRTGSIKLLLVVAMMVGAGASIAYKSRGHKRVDPNIKVVEIKLDRNVEIRPELAADDSGLGESFSSMMARLHPYAAINGTYYDPAMRPLGDILINGKLVNRGGQHHAIAITKSGKIAFISKRRGRFNWSGYHYGLACGPRLIHKGKRALNPVADGFSKRSLTLTAWRCGIGTTDRNTLLLVTATKDLTLSDFADVMLDLGAVEAMNLDGGGACGLYHNGRMLATPSLSMSNILWSEGSSRRAAHQIFPHESVLFYLRPHNRYLVSRLRPFSHDNFNYRQCRAGLVYYNDKYRLVGVSLWKPLFVRAKKGESTTAELRLSANKRV